MPAIECYPVGDMALVCSRINGAVAVVDRHARSILEGLSGGVETGELVRRHAEAAGGLDQASAQVAALRHLWSRAAAAASTAPFSDLLSPKRGSLALDVVCRFGERPVRLQVWPPRLARIVGAVTAPCHDYSGTAEADATITVVRAGGRYRLAVDGVVCLETRELMVARSEVLRRLVLAAHPGRAWLAVLHAAGVAGPDGAILLCGSSGAGKSTLTGLLLASGLALVTDDYAPLEVGTRALWPVPFGLSVKDGSWPLLKPHFPDFSRTAVIRTKARRQRYLRPPSFAATPQRVRSLVFPLYAPGTPLEVVRLEPGETLALCTRSGGWYESSPERLRELADWIGSTPAYAMSYGDGAGAVTAVRRLLGL